MLPVTLAAQENTDLSSLAAFCLPETRVWGPRRENTAFIGSARWLSSTSRWGRQYRYDGTVSGRLVGLDYAKNRYYSNILGRFLTPDPYQATDSGANNPADPGSWNRYAYAGNDPVNWYDPSGLYQCPPGTFCISWTPPDGITVPSSGEGGGGFGVRQHYADRSSSQIDQPGSLGLVGLGNVDDAAAIAINALENRKDCAGMFSGANPVTVLNSLISGNSPYGSIKWDNLGPPDNGSVTAAQTSGILGRSPQGTSIFTGATITINDNLSAPWFGGYPDTFQIGNPTSNSTQNIYRAMTLLHELGHLFNIVTGLGSSTIVTPDPGGVSGKNTAQVFENCFKQLPGGHP